jgi:hypothetical protein
LVKLALITKSKAMNHFIVPLDFSMINEYGSGLGHDSKPRYIMSSAIDKWNVMLGSYARQMAKNSPVPLLSIRVSAPLEDHE